MMGPEQWSLRQTGLAGVRCVFLDSSLAPLGLLWWANEAHAGSPAGPEMETRSRQPCLALALLGTTTSF